MIKRIAIFAHWDKGSQIDDYVVYYLRELKKVADILFVSDGNLPIEELKKIEPFVINSTATQHGEYDFGSYKRGFLAAKDILKDYDELIFANDSCYGPFYPFEEIWKEMDAKSCDYWGLFKHSDPKMNAWHIQSYFIVFKKQVFSSLCFREFIKGITKEKSKGDVILKYEVGLSGMLEQAGFRSAALCPQSTQNETHQKKLYDLITTHKLPFLKKAFLATNPCREPFIYSTASDVALFLQDKYPYELIQRHLERTAPKNYFNHWFHPTLIETAVLHKNFIRIKEKGGKFFCYLRVKVLGITILVLPSRFLLHRWRHENNPRTNT